MWACCCAADATEDAIAVTAQPSDARDENVETKIQPTIEVIPPGEVSGSSLPKSAAFGSFQVVVPTKDFSTLGLELDLTDPSTPMISKIGEGAIQKFNKVFAGSSLKPYDVLVTLDEARNWEQIEKKMNGQLPEKMTLGVKRPRKVQVTFEKTGPMGMKLDYKNDSVGAILQDLDPSGLLATWNSKNASDAIGPGDRIVEFDGQTYLGGELMEQLKTQSTMKLTVLKY